MLAGVGNRPDTIWVVGALALAIAVASATQDIAIDAYAVDVLRRFRCVLPRECHGAFNTSLCKSYCTLMYQYCDEGRLAEARRCLGECLREVRPSLYLPVRDLLKAASKAYTPGLHKLGKRVFQGTP